MTTTNEEVNLYVQIFPKHRAEGTTQFNPETLYFELFSFKWRAMG